jgi:hypothetical protein
VPIVPQPRGPAETRPKPTLAQRRRAEQHDRVLDDALISRSEVTAMLFAFADINANVERIVDLLENGPDGEEEIPEEDS